MKKVKPITEKDIAKFLKQAQLVRDSSYISATRKSRVDIKYEQESGIKFEADMPMRQDIESILTRIRPFIEYKERLHVGRIISYLLDKHGESKVLRAYQTLFTPEGERKYPAITHNGKDYRVRDLLIQYMYGRYLHLDQKKEEVIESFEKSLGPLAEYFALNQVDRYIGIILGVAGYIKKHNLQNHDNN